MHFSQAAQGAWLLRERQRLQVGGDGLVHLAKFLPSHAQVVERVPQARIKLAGLLKPLGCLLMPAQRNQHQSQVIVEDRSFRRHLDRFGKPFQRFQVLAALILQDAQQVQGIGVVGGGAQHGAVELLGFSQASGVVVLQGRLQAGQ